MFNLKTAPTSPSATQDPLQELKDQIAQAEAQIQRSEADLNSKRTKRTELATLEHQIESQLSDDRSALSALKQRLQALEFDTEIEEYVKALRPVADKINDLAQQLEQTVIEFRELAAQGQRGGIPESKRVKVTDTVDLGKLPKARYQLGTRGFLLVEKARPVYGEN